MEHLHIGPQRSHARCKAAPLHGPGFHETAEFPNWRCNSCYYLPMT
jgi:hypothetical protein